MINHLKKYMDKGNNSKRPNNKKLINIKPENIKAQLRQSQDRYVHTILENEITLCQGPAGTSKTFTACYTALKLLANKEISQIVLCKPIQEAGEKLGFLPGDKRYKSDKGKGWGVLAKSLGIKPGSQEFHALKSGDDLYGIKSNTKSKEKDKGKVKKKK